MVISQEKVLTELTGDVCGAQNRLKDNHDFIDQQYKMALEADREIYRSIVEKYTGRK